MIFKDIRDAYAMMVQGTDFLYKCKDRQITRDDLEKKVYPKLSDEFKDLEEKGQELRRGKSNFNILTCQIIAYTAHGLLHYKKINETSKYARENILNQCTLE